MIQTLPGTQLVHFNDGGGVYSRLALVPANVQPGQQAVALPVAVVEKNPDGGYDMAQGFSIPSSSELTQGYGSFVNYTA